MEFLGPFHPQIVHTPIALLVFSLAFDLVGRATDSAWWRKASLALLVLGVLGGALAVVSGNAIGDTAEERQGIPESVVDAHEDMGKIAAWIAAGALAARLVENGAGAARGAVGAVALLLQLAAAVTVGIAGHRGGVLVYQHGAGVSIEDRMIRNPNASPKAREGERGEKARDAAPPKDGEAKEREAGERGH